MNRDCGVVSAVDPEVFRTLLEHSRYLPQAMLGRRILRLSRKGQCPRRPDGLPDPEPLLREYETAQARLDPRRWQLRIEDEWKHKLLDQLAIQSDRLRTALKAVPWPRSRRLEFFKERLREVNFPETQVQRLARFLDAQAGGWRHSHASLADAGCAESLRITRMEWSARLEGSPVSGRDFRKTLSPEERRELLLLGTEEHARIAHSRVREATSQASSGMATSLEFAAGAKEIVRSLRKKAPPSLTR